MCYMCTPHQLLSGNLVLSLQRSNVSLSVKSIFVLVCVGMTMHCAKMYSGHCGCTPGGLRIERVRWKVPPVPQVLLHGVHSFHCATRWSEVCICCVQSACCRDEQRMSLHFDGKYHHTNEAVATRTLDGTQVWYRQGVGGNQITIFLKLYSQHQDQELTQKRDTSTPNPKPVTKKSQNNISKQVCVLIWTITDAKKCYTTCWFLASISGVICSGAVY